MENMTQKDTSETFYRLIKILYLQIGWESSLQVLLRFCALALTLSRDYLEVENLLA